MRETEDISVVILSGGQSRRMGTDKARLVLDGKTFADHLKDSLTGDEGCLKDRVNADRPLVRCSEIMFSVRHEDDFQDIAIPHIADQYPGCGPLAGIHSGLKHAGCDWLFVVACDTPFVTHRTIEELYGHVSEDCDAVVPVEENGRCHVLCGLYHRRALDLIGRALESGNYRVMSVLAGLKTNYVPVTEFTDGAAVFRNVNTPEAYREACGS